MRFDVVCIQEFRVLAQQKNAPYIEEEELYSRVTFFKLEELRIQIYRFLTGPQFIILDGSVLKMCLVTGNFSSIN